MLSYLSKSRVNFPMVIKVLGWLLIIEAGFMAIPAITALWCGERSEAWSFSLSAAITAVAGLATCRIHPRHNDMGKREGFLLTASVWIVFSAFGMLPMIFSPFSHMGVTDAFFEAMSGFTTTGASLLDPSGPIPQSIHIWRCLSQWIGGMGIILFTLAVIPMLNHSGGMQMFNAEVTGITHDKIRPRISQTAKSLWGVYIILTFLAMLLLWAGPMDLFDAACHAMSTLSTGGFSTSPDGIDAWNSTYVKVVLIIFMFLGGVNFSLIFHTVTGRLNYIRENETFRAYVAVIAVSLVVFAIAIVSRSDSPSLTSAVVDPLFQIVSTITSTGYTLAVFDDWGTMVLSITLLLMFIGACAGSTSGGAKIDRVLLLAKYLRNELRRCIRPNAILPVRVNRRSVPVPIVDKVVAFLCFYMLLIVAGGVALTAVGVPLFDAFFAAFSCISNTGLDAAITGYGSNYMLISDPGKWILAALMLTGRLELYTVLILFSRSFWRK